MINLHRLKEFSLSVLHRRWDSIRLEYSIDNNSFDVNVQQFATVRTALKYYKFLSFWQKYNNIAVEDEITAEIICISLSLKIEREYT